MGLEEGDEPEWMCKQMFSPLVSLSCLLSECLVRRRSDGTMGIRSSDQVLRVCGGRGIAEIDLLSLLFALSVAAAVADAARSVICSTLQLLPLVSIKFEESNPRQSEQQPVGLSRSY